MDVLQAHQWNGGGGACEGAEQQKGTKGPNDSCSGLKQVDWAFVVGMSTMAAGVVTVLAAVQG
jgi:hypothetical protein